MAITDYEKFLSEYIKLTGTLKQYADGVWFSLTDENRRNPTKAAEDKAKHFLRLQHFKVSVKKVTKGNNHTWCVFINNIEYSDCQVKSVAEAIAATVRRDHARLPK